MRTYATKCKYDFNYHHFLESCAEDLTFCLMTLRGNFGLYSNDFINIFKISGRKMRLWKTFKSISYPHFLTYSKQGTNHLVDETICYKTDADLTSNHNFSCSNIVTGKSIVTCLAVKRIGGCVAFSSWVYWEL